MNSGIPSYDVEACPTWSADPRLACTTGTSSHYAMEIGLAVHRAVAAGLGLLYVSLTDFVQHKEGPGRGDGGDRVLSAL